MAYTYNNEITFQNNAAQDAFGRLRVSEIQSLLNIKQTQSNLENIIYNTKTSGGKITYFSGDSMTRLTVTGDSNSYVIRQTKQRVNYQAGKSILGLFSGGFSGGTNAIVQVGFLNNELNSPYLPNNGIFFEKSGTTIAFCIAKNGVITRVIQSNWNIDKMDGLSGITNPSKILINTSKVQIIVIDYEWLGVGRVRVGFNIDGQTYYVHQFKNANNSNSVYTRTPNFHVTYSIRAFGAGTFSMDQICTSVDMESNVDPTGVIRALNSNTSSTLTAPDGIAPLIAVRLKATNLDAVIEPYSISMVNIGGNNAFLAHLYLMDGKSKSFILGGTTPTAWSAVTFTNLPNSPLEYINNFSDSDRLIETGQTTIKIYSEYASNQTKTTSSEIHSSIWAGNTIDGVRDVYVVAAERIGSNIVMSGAITVRTLD